MGITLLSEGNAGVLADGCLHTGACARPPYIMRTGQFNPRERKEHLANPEGRETCPVRRAGLRCGCQKLSATFPRSLSPSQTGWRVLAHGHRGGPCAHLGVCAGSRTEGLGSVSLRTGLSKRSTMGGELSAARGGAGWWGGGLATDRSVSVRPKSRIAPDRSALFRLFEKTIFLVLGACARVFAHGHGGEGKKVMNGRGRRQFEAGVGIVLRVGRGWVAAPETGALLCKWERRVPAFAQKLWRALCRRKRNVRCLRTASMRRLRGEVGVGFFWSVGRSHVAALETGARRCKGGPCTFGGVYVRGGALGFSREGNAI
ncbi:MAG: hypothetical protein JWR26_1140 [Pedosphaera sp.]|nr:hypothetical protein [Pedosphaera sp.]